MNQIEIRLRKVQIKKKVKEANMVSSKEAVTNVVTRIEQTCHEDLLSLQSEYEKSTESINYLIEVSFFVQLHDCSCHFIQHRF